MKKLFFLLVIVFSFSNLMAAQNNDSIQLKENLIKLNQNLKEIREFSNKIEKQIIEKETLLIRFKKFFSSDGNKLTSYQRSKIDSLRVALKPEDHQILIPSQEPQIEQRPKTFFGRLWSKNKFREYRYIITSDSTKIYIQ